MKQYCTKCRKNIITVTQEDEANDESYEYCPGCWTDIFLEGYRDNPPIIDEEMPTVTASKVFDMAAWKEQKDDDQKRQEERIIKYQEVFDQFGPEAAEKSYFGN